MSEWTGSVMGRYIIESSVMLWEVQPQSHCSEKIMLWGAELA